MTIHELVANQRTFHSLHTRAATPKSESPRSSRQCCSISGNIKWEGLVWCAQWVACRDVGWTRGTTNSAVTDQPRRYRRRSDRNLIPSLLRRHPQFACGGVQVPKEKDRKRERSKQKPIIFCTERPLKCGRKQSILLESTYL